MTTPKDKPTQVTPAFQPMSFPHETWLQLLGHGYSPFPKKVLISRETTRSWVVGPVWDEDKYAKKHTKFLTEVEAQEIIWCLENSWRIAQCVNNGLDPKIIRQIAQLVGYKEPGKDGGK